jgi:hypothetical protein
LLGAPQVERQLGLVLEVGRKLDPAQLSVQQPCPLQRDQPARHQLLDGRQGRFDRCAPVDGDGDQR